MPKSPVTNIYDLDYFSGSQMFMYIGDVWVDEVTSLQYATQQQKTPLYGYASQLFETVAAGPVIVQGSFTINYKEQGYLWAVLRRFKHITEAGAGISVGEGKKSARDLKKQKRRDANLFENRLGGGSGQPVTKPNTKTISRATIEDITGGQATRQSRYQFYQQLAGYATVDVGSARDKTFEDIAEAFEDQVWTRSSDQLNSQIRRTDDNKFDNFDMYVVFGNYANPGANHTVQKIIGVHLTSQGKMINIDGMPVQEQYTFIARTVA